MTLEAQLTEAQESTATLEAQLTEAQEGSAALEARLTEAQENSASLEARLTEAQEGSASLEAQLTEAQENSASLEAQLTEAQENSASLEAQLTEEQKARATLEAELSAAQARSKELEAQLTEAQEEQAANVRSQYAIYAANEAVEAFSARTTELEDSVTTAQTRVENLTKVLAEVDSGIAGITGQDIPAPEPQPLDGAETAAPAAEPMRIVPEVRIPDALEQTAGLDADALHSEIEAILTADESEMSAEEKAAALQDIRAEVSSHVESLKDAIEDISAQKALLAATMGNSSAMEAELASFQQNVDELSAAVAEGENSIANLEAQLAEALNQSEADSARIDDLNGQIEGEQVRVKDLSEQLSAATTERDKYLAALEAYRISREPTAGEAHVASTVGNRIAVGADGASVNWHYVNNAASGNPAELRIEMDGEELYHSETIAPGGELNGFTLNRPLTTGEYQAYAITSVCDEDGNVVSSTRVPVTIVVE